MGWMNDGEYPADLSRVDTGASKPAPCGDPSSRLSAAGRERIAWFQGLQPLADPSGFKPLEGHVSFTTATKVVRETREDGRWRWVAVTPYTAMGPASFEEALCCPAEEFEAARAALDKLQRKRPYQWRELALWRQ